MNMSTGLEQAGEARQSDMAEIVVWHSANEVLPDSDITVMIICGGDTEAWPGYWDGETWRTADGVPLSQVIYWTDMLEGPQP